jgi:glutamate-ammonia-ligase adenylyltransferase
MRQRIANEKGSKNSWELKYVNGGLVDIEFIAQYLQLIHAHEDPAVLDTSTIAALEALRNRGHLAVADAEIVLEAARLYQSLTQLMRLCQDGRFDPDKAPEGLKAMLSRAAEVPDFSRIEPRLAEMQAAVAARFDKLVK